MAVDAGRRAHPGRFGRMRGRPQGLRPSGRHGRGRSSSRRGSSTCTNGWPSGWTGCRRPASAPPAGPGGGAGPVPSAPGATLPSGGPHRARRPTSSWSNSTTKACAAAPAGRTAPCIPSWPSPSGTGSWPPSPGPGCTVVASANPGCSMWLAAAGVQVRHPMEIVAEAMASRGWREGRPGPVSSTTSAVDQVIAEELADLALDRLRESVDAGATALPAEERRLTRARRAVERAVGILAEPDDHLQGPSWAAVAPSRRLAVPPSPPTGHVWTPGGGDGRRDFRPRTGRPRRPRLLPNGAPPSCPVSAPSVTIADRSSPTRALPGYELVPQQPIRAPDRNRPRSVGRVRPRRVISPCALGPDGGPTAWDQACDPRGGPTMLAP